MTRRRATAILLSAILAATTAVLAGDVGALEQESVTLPPESVVERDYPPIPAQDPAFVTVDHTVIDPPTCAAMPSCHLVPIDVQAPDVAEGDDFSMSLTISWASEQVSDNNVQPLQSNDLDVFLYDDGQTAEAEGSSGYTEIGSSASGDNPERVQVYEPLLGRYNLVVINFVGGNTGWTLTAESILGRFVTPFEVLAPAPGSGTRNPANKPTTTTTRPTTTTTAPTTTTVSIPEGVVLPDDDFDGGAFDPESAFADPQVALAELESLRNLRDEASSPSALSLLLWLVAFPVALAGGVLLLVRGRRRGSRRATTAH